MTRLDAIEKLIALAYRLYDELDDELNAAGEPMLVDRAELDEAARAARS